jgi:hypothetical protein
MNATQAKRDVPVRRLGLPIIVTQAIYAVLAAAAVWLAAIELRASPLQALVFSRLANDLTFWVEPGSNLDARYP